MTFTITIQPYYDRYHQCYKNILMINIEPKGPLRRLVRKINLPRLSPFDTNNYNFDKKCGLAIQNINGIDELMSPNEMPNLISFLLENGYQIDTQITNMLNNSLRVALTATYYGNSQPGIVYMR